MGTNRSPTACRAVLNDCFVSFRPGLGSCSEDEERLVRDLFRGYNKLVRPVQNMSMKVEVKFGLTFTQLISVVSTLPSTFRRNALSHVQLALLTFLQNEKNQVMKSNVWLRLVSNLCFKRLRDDAVLGFTMCSHAVEQ